uniref:Uncharacterized protein n=1 Tax=Tanacetum cinerariifolium TaxID=118510 RepID=A0A6L2KXK9_TANCI|nr:hypothetical protein [Tanacetum cinerariifolium]
MQPEGRKYVTIVRHNQTGHTVSYDQLYGSLVQFEPHIQASNAKRVAKNHDPLALIAQSNAFSWSHASPSYSNSPQPYYVTQPSSVNDYEEDYQVELQGDSQEDKLTTAIVLLARAIIQKFSTPTNNRLHTSSNIRKQAVIQDGRVDIQTKNAGYGGNGNRNAGRQTGIKHLMQETYSNHDGSNSMTEPIYDAKAINEVNALHEAHEQVNHVQRKTIIDASDDDQIDSNIIFDDPNVENNGGTSEHDSNDHDEYHNIQILAYNTTNKVYDPFLKAGLGYKNPELLKKAIAAQPKIYHGEMLYIPKLKFDSPDSEETLEDAEESRLKMRNKMVMVVVDDGDVVDGVTSAVMAATVVEVMLYGVAAMGCGGDGDVVAAVVR